MDKLCILIANRDRHDLVSKQVQQLQRLCEDIKHRIVVVECGSATTTKHSTLWYRDDDFKGKCYGHNQGLKWYHDYYGEAEYYLFLMNDVFFEQTNINPIKHMLSTMSDNNKIGILSPFSKPECYPLSRPSGDGPSHDVVVCDYLALMFRRQCLNDIGFLSQNFKYCWGAIHEKSYQAYRAGWRIAYSNHAWIKHLGGSTYGKIKTAVSREEYVRRAISFASKYMQQMYGDTWDELFESVLPPRLIDKNIVPIVRKNWDLDVALMQQGNWKRDIVHFPIIEYLQKRRAARQAGEDPNGVFPSR